MSDCELGKFEVMTIKKSLLLETTGFGGLLGVAKKKKKRSSQEGSTDFRDTVQSHV